MIHSVVIEVIRSKGAAQWKLYLHA
jgi:hypothetical protein